MRIFSPEFRVELEDLMRWRRDVRHFRTDDIDEDALADCLRVFDFSPSVGLSQPWRLVKVKSKGARAAALGNFQAANADALKGYDGDQKKLYASLKLSGMQDAPVHLAVFCADDTPKGAGLGAQTMPEMRRYSVVTGIMNFWLRCRAEGLGLGWVSILDPDKLTQDLDLPEHWKLVAYLCIGYPAETSLTPELEQKGWETRDLTLSAPLTR